MINLPEVQGQSQIGPTSGRFIVGIEGELYDLNEDPGEQMNLWDDLQYAAVRTEMIKTIRKDLLALPMFHNRPIPGALI